MKVVVRFLGRHWIVTLLVVAIVFGIVLPNVEALVISRGSSLIQMILGGC